MGGKCMQYASVRWILGRFRYLSMDNVVWQTKQESQKFTRRAPALYKTLGAALIPASFSKKPMPPQTILPYLLVFLALVLPKDPSTSTRCNSLHRSFVAIAAEMHACLGSGGSRSSAQAYIWGYGTMCSNWNSTSPPFERWIRYVQVSQGWRGGSHSLTCSLAPANQRSLLCFPGTGTGVDRRSLAACSW